MYPESDDPSRPLWDDLELETQRCEVSAREVPARATNELYAVEVRGVLTRRECDALIAATEARGYEPALLNRGFGRQELVPSTRRGDRRIVDDARLARLLFERVRPFAPEVVGAYRLVGLNERLRFLKYAPGDYFRRHRDGCYERADGTGERSFLTLLLYLNDEYDGGFTTLFNHEHEETRVAPEPGLVLLHDHALLHESPDLKLGLKYAIRTDVMYAPIGG